MTVAELIEQLKHFEPHEEVVIMGNVGVCEADIESVDLVDEERHSQLSGKSHRVRWVCLS